MRVFLFIWGVIGIWVIHEDIKSIDKKLQTKQSIDSARINTLYEMFYDHVKESSK